MRLVAYRKALMALIVALGCFFACTLVSAQLPPLSSGGHESHGTNTPATPVPTVEAPSKPLESDLPSGVALTVNTTKFNFVVYIGALLFGGVGSIALFLILHKKANRNDWLWPVIPALFAGYLVVIAPMFVSHTAYDEWSAQCFDPGTYGDTRDPNANDAGPYKFKCASAQFGTSESVSVLGLGTVFSLYKQYVAGGLGQAIYPGEMHFLIWLVTAAWGGFIYFFFLRLRRIWAR